MNFSSSLLLLLLASSACFSSIACEGPEDIGGSILDVDEQPVDVAEDPEPVPEPIPEPQPDPIVEPTPVIEIQPPLPVVATEAPTSEEDNYVTPKPSHEIPIWNDMLDALIADTIAQHHDEIVPYHLEEQRVGFWRKIGPLNVTGEAGFTENTLDGLVNVVRLGDARLGKTKWGNIEMQLGLRVGPLELNTKAYARFLGIGPKISVQAGVTHADARAVLHFNHRTEEIAVKSFKVEELLGLRFKLTKAPGFVTPFVANQIIRGGLAVFTPAIRRAVTRVGGIFLDRLITDSEFVKDVMKQADKL